MIWLGSSRQCRKQGSMPIFELGLMFVLSGILGNRYIQLHLFFRIQILDCMFSCICRWELRCEVNFNGMCLFYVNLFRGFPVWLKYVPGISFRTDNEPFKVIVLVLLYSFWHITWC